MDGNEQEFAHLLELVNSNLIRSKEKVIEGSLILHRVTFVLYDFPI